MNLIHSANNKSSSHTHPCVLFPVPVPDALFTFVFIIVHGISSSSHLLSSIFFLYQCCLFHPSPHPLLSRLNFPFPFIIMITICSLVILTLFPLLPITSASILLPGNFTTHYHEQRVRQLRDPVRRSLSQTIAY